MKKTATKKTRPTKSKKNVRVIRQPKSAFLDFKKDNLMVLAALVVILGAGILFLVAR